MAERVIDRTVGWLTRNPLVYSTLASEPVYRLLEMGVSMYIRSLEHPTNEILLGKLATAEKLGSFLLPKEQERVFESKGIDILKQDLEESIKSGGDTNSTLKLKRTLGLMGKKYLNKLLLDFFAVNFGLGTLKNRFLAQQGLPSFHYLTLQVNSECNARPRCPGCFAEQDQGKLPYETLEKVQKEAIALGSRFTIIVGGEPLIERGALLKLFRKYNRMPYLLATNGILLDDSYAKEAADLGNVVTFINIPGLESTANRIRGNTNAWNHTRKAAESLRKYRAASGFVSTVSQTNFTEVSSGEFVQQMVDFGMMLGFYFAYTDPLGCSPKTELALTPEMTESFSQRVKDVSGKYPLYLIDTSGGREKLIGGCPAGRTGLIYIHSDGRVGGCPMVPQTDAGLNVNNLPLSEILRSNYFERIRQERPSCLRSPQFWANLQAE